MLTSLFIVAFSLSAASTPGPAPTTPDEFLDSLQAPVRFENVRPIVELRGGVHLELGYDLPEVGPISIAMHTDDGGEGLGLVTVGERVVIELRFAEGSVAWETVDFSALSPAQAHGVAASIVQVWQEDAVTEAFTVATVDDRDLKCTIAGQLAGAVSGVGAFAACELVVANPVTCGKAGGGAWGWVAFHITNKCNGAQNH